MLSNTNRIFGLGLIGLLAVVYYCYSLGFPHGFEFDDLHNLDGLREIHDGPSLLSYIFEGKAGPLGRPLSLLTFAAQAYAWPSSPGTFLHLNACLHLLNGLMVCWLAYRLARDYFPSIAKPEYYALLAAAVWLVEPLLASTSLFVVQRMTSLSAFFVLAGTLSHVVLLSRLPSAPRTTVWLIAISMFLFTGLGALAKENGALLPLLLATLHLTIIPFKHEALRGLYRSWPIALFVPPLLGLFVYAVTLDYSALYSSKDFSLQERLLTECRILFIYLRLLLLPLRSELGPFHDDIEVSRSFAEPSSLLATGSLVLLLSAAIVKRRAWPVFSFAALWFLVAHLLESTIFPLELYFEHRNYVAVVGPVLAMIYAAFNVPQNYFRLAMVGVVAYVLLLGAVLGGTTAVWGDKRMAAELWHTAHPKSERAVQNLASIYAKEGNPKAGLEMLQKLAVEMPDDIGLAFQIAYFQAQLNRDFSGLNRLTLGEGARLLEVGKPGMLICQMFEVSEQDEDTPLAGSAGAQRVYALTEHLLKNPGVIGRWELRFCVHRFAAMYYRADQNLPGTMYHLEEAFRAYPVMSMGAQLVIFSADAGLFKEARKELELVRASAPLNPILRARWFEEADTIERWLNSVESNASVTAGMGKVESKNRQ